MDVDGERAPAFRAGSAQRPRDSATLILVRSDGPELRILMGRRHERHSFMPGKFVFPGGAVDPCDAKVPPAVDLESHTLAKLMLRMRGRPSARRARALAMAAVRETFEETGLIMGRPIPSLSPVPDAGAWQPFLNLGFAPDLSRLTFVARAITPPGRTRRYDSRFFLSPAGHLANLDTPARRANDELLAPRWFSFAQARALDLPSITREILSRLEHSLSEDGTLRSGCPVIFGYSKGKSWRRDEL
jgi:8-oxo-dGTP pyrophosphatase MutT (NUDIX family)